MRVKVTCFVEIPHQPDARGNLDHWVLTMIGNALHLNTEDALRRLSLTWEETKVPKK